jgi:hypothetical protein
MKWCALVLIAAGFVALCSAECFAQSVKGNSPGKAEALAAVLVDGSWGYIDDTGRVVIPPQFDRAGRFSDQLAFVERERKVFIIDLAQKLAPVGSVGGWYPPEAVQEFSEGLGGFNFAGKWGFRDRTGKEVIPPEFDNVRKFSEQMAAVQVGGKWGFLDMAKRRTIPKYVDDWFDDVGERFSDHMAAVKVRDRWGYIDKKGKMVVAPRFDRAADFSERLARVLIAGKWGYIDQFSR